MNKNILYLRFLVFVLKTYSLCYSFKNEQKYFVIVRCMMVKVDISPAGSWMP